MVPDLAVGRADGAQGAGRPVDVPHQLLVGDSPAARTAAAASSGARARGLARVQVGAQRQVAVVGEPAGDLLGLLVVAGEVVDHHHAAEGTVGQGLGQIGLDLVAAVPGDRDRLCSDRRRSWPPPFPPEASSAIRAHAILHGIAMPL